MRPLPLGILLLALIAAVVAAGLLVGSVPVPPGRVAETLRGGGDPVTRTIVVDLRLPRVVLALLVGGGLALAGAVFQALLRNPLAEPYILGVSGGAGAGAVLALATGVAAAGAWILPLAAFAGALVAIVLVFGVAASASGRVDVRVLLLAGVVVGAFFTAVLALVLSLSEAERVRSAILWMMGSLWGADWGDVVLAGGYTVPAAILLMAVARPLNLLAVGEETAQYLGTDVERVKRLCYGVASLLAAAGVAVAGIIGFVGLIVPHAVRLVAGSDHRALLPLSFLAGAFFLALADVAARTLLAPTEIPIGVVTALVGVPFFLVLLRRTVRT